MADGTFEAMHGDEIKGTTRIFRSRFIDDLNRVVEKVRLNSRLVPQAYAYE